MKTIKTLLSESKKSLKDSGIPSYSLDADLIMAHVLKTSKEEVFCHPERILYPNQDAEFKRLIAERYARKPMAHILGVREFWERSFKVTQDTLDPRPDSESLIEQVLQLYKNLPKPKRIIDFGTGTGCLLLTLLSEFDESQGVGVDISETAIAVAQENAEKLGLAKRTSFVVSNWGKKIKGEYDLIISNPPYIKKSDIDGLEPEVSTYEPKQALDGGDGGLDCYIILASDIFPLLAEGGFAVLEHGIGQEADVKRILENNGFKFVANKPDLSGINRCVTVKK
jgi:release factor glutamine methyltransferase